MCVCSCACSSRLQSSLITRNRLPSDQVDVGSKTNCCSESERLFRPPSCEKISLAFNYFCFKRSPNHSHHLNHSKLIPKLLTFELFVFQPCNHGGNLSVNYWRSSICRISKGNFEILLLQRVAADVVWYPERPFWRTGFSWGFPLWNRCTVQEIHTSHGVHMEIKFKIGRERSERDNWWQKQRGDRCWSVM